MLMETCHNLGARFSAKTGNLTVSYRLTTGKCQAKIVFGQQGTSSGFPLAPQVGYVSSSRVPTHSPRLKANGHLPGLPAALQMWCEDLWCLDVELSANHNPNIFRDCPRLYFTSYNFSGGIGSTRE